MSVLAIIPARGGSKGIPRKNLVEVGGRPLLTYTVEHALAAPDVTEVLVSTDCDEIAVVAANLGARVVRRPAAISGDSASSESALLHALEAERERVGRDPELVVFLQATSPLRPPGAVSGAVQTLLRESADSLFSASPVHGFVWRLRDGVPTPVNYDFRHRPRRQDAAEHLEENGSTARGCCARAAIGWEVGSRSTGWTPSSRCRWTKRTIWRELSGSSSASEAS